MQNGTLEAPSTNSDIWSDWLLHRRQADNADYHAVVKRSVDAWAQRVLDGAALKPGMTLVDIGSGEGIMPFKAIERVGQALQVVVTDISAPMLEYAKQKSVELGIRSQCSFVQCSGDRLEGIPDQYADVVTTRASLAYVADKAAAFREIFRVLKPGGRLSIVEPVFADDALLAQQMRRQVEAQGETSENLLLRLLSRCRSAQFPDTEEGRMAHPLTNYTERDLFAFAQNAGFKKVHLELHIDSDKSEVTTWEVLLGGSPHPWSPTFGEILDAQFSPEERGFFERTVRPLVESGANLLTERNAFITAVKPGGPTQN